jgi:hypothetical protein
VDGTLVTGVRFDEAIARFDAAHAEDPEKDASGQPAELVYAQRMSAWLARLAPDASEALRLAVRCQHIRRWAIRRADYPAGTAGYRKWRVDEAASHAETARELLEESGYDGPAIRRVQSLLRKEQLKQDPEAQLLEDVICLVFLENYLARFAQKHDEAKLVDILRKTWNKMSSRGQEAALGLKLPAPLRAIIERAVSK